MQLKKILFSILVAIMMFSLVAFVATANDDANTSFNLVAELDSATKVEGYSLVEAGDTIKYVLKIENNPGVAAFMATISYDEDALSYLGYDIGVVFVPAAPAVAAESEDSESASLPEKFVVDATDTGLISLEGVKSGFKTTDKNGVIVTLKFKVDESFHGEIEDLLVLENEEFVFMGSLEDGLPTIDAGVTNVGTIKVHDYSVTTIPHTCTEAGVVKYSCSKCDDVLSYVDSSDPASGHNYGAWTTKTPATSTKDGEATRTCSNCGEVESVVLPKFTSFESKWLKGTDASGLNFVTGADYADFKSVSVDGKELSKNDYVTSEGSTKVLLKADYLNGLEEGEHKLTITSVYGDAEINFTVEAESSSALIIIIVVIAVVVVGVVATVVVLKKKELI